jgi:hypothetical protein
MVEAYYKIGLVHTNLTNRFHTTHQHLSAPASLKTVSAVSQKQETNVFPNGHPLQIDLCYPDFIVGVMLCHHPLMDTRNPASPTASWRNAMSPPPHRRGDAVPSPAPSNPTPKES